MAIVRPANNMLHARRLNKPGLNRCSGALLGEPFAENVRSRFRNFHQGRKDYYADTNDNGNENENNNKDDNNNDGNDIENDINNDEL